jgi:hypothetical protein
MTYNCFKNENNIVEIKIETTLNNTFKIFLNENFKRYKFYKDFQNFLLRLQTIL